MRLKGPTRRIARGVKSSSIKCSPLALIIHGRKWNMKTLEIHFFKQFFQATAKPPFAIPATAVFTSNYFRTPGRENCGLPTVYGFIVSKFFPTRRRVFFRSFRYCCKIRSNVDSVDNRTGVNLIGRSACRT